jgi:hypothetical protein
MADVAAVPAVAQEQLIIYFGGEFDRSMMGAPVYFWCMFFLGMIAFLAVMWWVYHRYFILDKVWAFVTCYKNKQPLALIRTRFRKAYFKPLKYIAQIFMDEESPDKWFAPALETSSNLEGVNLIEAVDYYDWLQDPILNQAVHELVQEWNTIHEKDEDKIYDPVQFQEKLASGRMSTMFEGKTEIVYKKGQVPVPAFFVVDISKIEQYLPRTRSSAMFGGYTQHMADDMGKGEKVDWKSYMLPVMALCTLMIICGIVAGLLATGKL